MPTRRSDDPASGLTETTLSRRGVLRSLAAAGVVGLPQPRGARARAALGPFDSFEHVVVLMLENRSFDNLLGYLYAPGEAPRGQAFEGVAGKTLANPIPAGADGAERAVVAVAPGEEMDNPNPDPGEEYPHVNTQLFGTVLPEANRHRPAEKMEAPYNAPASPAVAPMTGFVQDYIDNYVRTEKRAPTYDEYRVIMDCFPSDAVPVLSTLAKRFAVCDAWHCAVPSQTFCNRSFFHAASSSGAVINAPYAHWVTDNRAETIFNRIDAVGNPQLSWQVYFDQDDVVSLTGLIHYPVLKDALGTRFAQMDRFFADAASGNLPSYAFVEPRLFLNHNDMHPPIKVLGKTQPSSVLAGEQLVNRIYDAIRLADNPNGSNWRNTLLVITFDEHGGCYDHVPPPTATPPEASAPAGQMGFRFDRLGLRVPTILVSAWVEPGTVINDPLHHNSLTKTLSEKWGLGHLTDRDRTAPDLDAAFPRSTPWDRAEWPVITPRALPPEQQRASNADHPLNGLQRSIVGLATAIAGDPTSLPDNLTVLEAMRYMERTIGSSVGS